MIRFSTLCDIRIGHQVVVFMEKVYFQPYLHFSEPNLDKQNAIRRSNDVTATPWHISTTAASRVHSFLVNVLSYLQSRRVQPLVHITCMSTGVKMVDYWVSLGYPNRQTSKLWAANPYGQGLMTSDWDKLFLKYVCVCVRCVDWKH